MPSSFIFLHRNDENEEAIMNCSDKIAIKMPTEILFSNLLSEEEKFKKESVEILKNLKEIINFYNKTFKEEFKGVFNTIFNYNKDKDSFIDILTMINMKNNEIKNKYKEKIVEFNKVKMIKFENKFKFVAFIYVEVDKKNKADFVKNITEYIAEELIHKYREEDNKVIYRFPAYKKETKMIIEKLSEKYKIITEMENKSIHNEFKEEILKIIKETHKLYLVTIFYRGLIESVQRNGHPLEYFYVQSDNPSEYVNNKKLHKEKTVKVEIDTLI